MYICEYIHMHTRTYVFLYICRPYPYRIEGYFSLCLWNIYANWLYNYPPTETY